MSFTMPFFYATSRFGKSSKKHAQPIAPPPPRSKTPRFALPSQKKAIAEAEAAEQSKPLNKLGLKEKKNALLGRTASDPTGGKTRYKSKVAPTSGTKKKVKKQHRKREQPKKKSLVDKLNPSQKHEEPLPPRRASLLDKLTPNNRRNSPPAVPAKKSRGFRLGKKKNPPPPPKQSTGKKLMTRFKRARQMQTEPRY